MAMPGYDEESPICEARGGPAVGSPSTLSAGEAVVQNEPGLERRGSVDASSDVPCSSSTSDSVQLVSSFSYRVASQQVDWRASNNYCTRVLCFGFSVWALGVWLALTLRR